MHTQKLFTDYKYITSMYHKLKWHNIHFVNWDFLEYWKDRRRTKNVSHYVPRGTARQLQEGPGFDSGPGSISVKFVFSPCVCMFIC